MKRLNLWAAALLLMLGASMAHAELTIEITKGSDQAIPIAIVPMAGGEALPEKVSRIIGNDLERSGRFEPLPRESLISTPSSSEDVYYQDWQQLGSDYLVVGRVENQNGQYRIQYELLNVNGEDRMLGEVVTSSPEELRDSAHYISNQIFESITGIRGAFLTNIAYVRANGVGDNIKYTLNIADADGHNNQVILTSDEPILSPAWSPDGKKLAYVSFETGRSAIYVQNIATGQRVRLTSFEGINGAPAWSPDGRKLAMSLSKEGQPEIYVMDLASRDITRLTHSEAIDTEPDWAPNGDSLIFTSDRSGNPQIYRYNLSAEQAQRITFTGSYNSRGRFSPYGDTIFMVTRDEQGFHIARQNLETDRMTILTESNWDESPSVAPNGTMVIFATQEGNRGVLGLVSADGSASFRLPSPEGDVRSPAWSPFLN
ncbi:TolB protein [Chromohalobacter marismortui]|uniref:Tol-Pal system protein TolB n=1 Tax=Chromohalobacter marismortui TaxID=42055 RepID=A0A4V3F3T1_9GAMM|nr:MULTISPECIES: Tol-Pal system beta propeller repeat protein TolB [Chromohalobacter]MCI0508959.1 Tol-Pal system beta propeller repeat protein TolB [Chromohalobacter sp.]MCI0592311.1 Tol-Pal system beta propeller repeat protein TolB [Chromohalobacter sp.]TDU22666.1 TolB protein [Chromohalobacter marismortui]